MAAAVLPGLLVGGEPRITPLLAGATTATTLAPMPQVSHGGSPGGTPASTVAPAPVAGRKTATAGAAGVVTRVRTAPASKPPPAASASSSSSLPSGQVLALGDSVMLAGKAALIDALGGRVTVDAAIARQVDAGLDVLQRYRDGGALNDIAAVVVDLGTNGPMSAGQIDRLNRIVAGVPTVVVVNVRVPKRWEGQSNTSIGNGAASHGWRLADWYHASDHPGVLGRDGVHPTPSGARVYAHMIAEQVSGANPKPADPPPTTAPPPPTTTTTTTAPPPESTTTTTEPPTTTTTSTSTTTSTTSTTLPG
jgi:hypothetical protein